MNKIKKVALDIDDVLAAFYPGMCEWFEKAEVKCDIWDGEKDCKWIVDNFNEIKTNEEFWLGLATLSAANSITFDVTAYITSSPKEVLETRKKWLFGGLNPMWNYPKAPVFNSTDKVALMKKLGIDILVDDKIDTINAVNKAGLIGLQFKPDYMTVEIEDKTRIITHLSEVNKFL